MYEDWRNAFGILMCPEICDGAGTGICDGASLTCSSCCWSFSDSYRSYGDSCRSYSDSSRSHGDSVGVRCRSNVGIIGLLEESW